MSAPGDREEAEEAPAAGAPAFIKGELTHVGTRELLSRWDHIGIRPGVSTVDSDIYLGLAPGMAFYLDSGVQFALHVPLRLHLASLDELTSGGSVRGGSYRVRREDWDEVPDFAKVIRFITFGRKEYNVYFSINTMRPSTIGHGQLLNSYQPNMDVDRSMTGVLFDAYNRYAGFELQLNDITMTNRIFGALLFVKPLSLLGEGPRLEGFSIGAEYVGDFRAPRCVRMSADDPRCVQAGGHLAGNDPFGGTSRDDTFVRTDPDTGRFVVEEETVSAAGVSLEGKLYKDERNADIKAYGTFHKFLNAGGGAGQALGILARLNAGTDYIHAFRLRAEYRTFEDGYLPGYFNSLYEVEKYAFLYDQKRFQVTPTKAQYVFGDPENGFAKSDFGRRHGGNFEAQWGLFQGGRSGKKVAVALGLSDSSGPDDTNAYAHIEFPALGFLQLFGTYMRSNVASTGALFGGGGVASEDAILLTGMRLQILPILFLNAHYARSYKIVRSPGQEYHLGNDTIVDEQGNASPYFDLDRLYENVQTLFVDVELGWEFDEDEEE